MSSSITRRGFARRITATAAAAALAGAPAPAVLGAARPRVLVVGGGPGGVATARHLAASGAVEVTLVQRESPYISCFFGNKYLGGMRDLQGITHRYDRVQSDPHLSVVTATVEDVDVERRRVRLHDGAELGWDRLVLAPGIEIVPDAIEGYDDEALVAMPHAYTGGDAIAGLKRQLEAMPEDGLFVMAAPPDPYRCPPGPYERATLVAHWFSRHKPRARILIIDAKNHHSKQALFQRAWAQYYPGVLEWLPAEMTDGGVRAVHPASMELVTGWDTFTADVANVIPAQRAGSIARRAGVADQSGWCPIDPLSLGSTLVDGVHVVGDAAITDDMPKAAYAATREAGICAAAILSDLVGTPPPEPRYETICWSLLAPGDAVKLRTSFEVVDGSIRRTDAYRSDLDDPAAVRAANARDGQQWYDDMTRELFT